MNKSLWKFFLYFYNFQYILSFSFSKKTGLRVNKYLFYFNLVSPIVIYFLAIALSQNMRGITKTESVDLKNFSVLGTRIVKLFPITSTMFQLIIIVNLMKQKKLLRTGRKLISLIKIIELDMKSDLFKKFERKVFSFWLAHQCIASLSIITSIVSIVKPQIEAFLAMSILNWVYLTPLHIIMFYTIVLSFISTLTQKLEKDFENHNLNFEDCIERLRCIEEVLDDFNDAYKIQLNIAFCKTFIDIMIRVRKLSKYCLFLSS